jgi:dATP pyrophosphohydrolase
MSRAPFQILVIAFRHDPSDSVQYAVLTRQDSGHGQGVACGGEQGETPGQAAARELAEELGLARPVPLYSLSSTASIPAHHFSDRDTWPDGTYVIPEHTFAADVTAADITLSHEHTAIAWLDYTHASSALHWDSNKTALGELHERIEADDLPKPLGVFPPPARS